MLSFESFQHRILLVAFAHVLKALSRVRTRKVPKKKTFDVNNRPSEFFFCCLFALVALSRSRRAAVLEFIDFRTHFF